MTENLDREETLSIALLPFAAFGSKSAELQMRWVQALMSLFEYFPLLTLILFPILAA